MGWYDFFSRFYDKNLQHLYVEQRVAAADALRLAPGQLALDVPCGTGQSFDPIVARMPADGAIVGVDLSAGMLARARDRIARNGWKNVHVLERDVHAIDRAVIATLLGAPRKVDRLQVFLGMTAFPRWTDAFDRLWDLLEPGGRCVIVDVHTEKLGFQGRMVNLVARADIQRRFWQPLERVAGEFERLELPSRPEHGGKIHLATGVKPAIA